jgi:hypothetical protein
MKYILYMLAITMAVLAPCAAFATTTGDIMELVMVSRQKVVALRVSEDAGARDALLAEIGAATDAVSTQTQAMLEDPATPMNVKEKLVAFAGVWNEFLQTRDNELIPAIMAGDNEAAQALGQGVQADRIKQMGDLLK